ncbi:hypothetical protein ABW19_dt0207435 [Dactylella cylindrospora]|nr:hypothetical protein ABW19_dt0207435 [Dactylella cylindrospora]
MASETSRHSTGISADGLSGKVYGDLPLTRTVTYILFVSLVVITPGLPLPIKCFGAYLALRLVYDFPKLVHFARDHRRNPSRNVRIGMLKGVLLEVLLFLGDKFIPEVNVGYLGTEEEWAEGLMGIGDDLFA